MNSGPHIGPKRQRGLALVETAIVLPLLLFIMLAAAELTNAFVQHNTLTKIVRDGARHAAGKAMSNRVVFHLSPELVAETRHLVVYGNPAGTGAPILPNLTLDAVTVSDAGGEHVEVSVVYAYTGILGSVLPAFGFGPGHVLDMNLQASVRMRGL